MRYARLGGSGLIVSRLAFGAMTLGTRGMPALAKVDAAAAATLVDLAIERGVNLFDTADIYTGGQSESILGQALGARRKDVVVATKVGNRGSQSMTDGGLSARHIHASVDASLTRLGTDWIDVYICHRTDPLTPLEETLTALDQIVRAGKVRYLGFSNWPGWLAAKAMQLQKDHRLAPFVTGQMYYSLIGRDLEHEVVPAALDAGIGLMAWSPLAQGFLSGRYTQEDPAGQDGRLSHMNFTPFDLERGYAIVDVLRKVAADRGTTPAAAALAWLDQKPAVSTIILGMSNQRQMEQNLQAADLVLTAEEMAVLDAVSQPPAIYPHTFLKMFENDAARRAVASPSAET